MPKKTRKSKPKKIKKIARKPSRKSAKKSVRKKVTRKRTTRRSSKPARRPAAAKAITPVKTPRTPVKRKTAPTVPPMIAEERVGLVTHYYSHLSVAVIKLDQGALQVGDTIHIKGHTTDFQQRVESMQVEYQPIPRAQAGEEFGLKVTDHVREHDAVYKIRR